MKMAGPPLQFEDPRVRDASTLVIHCLEHCTVPEVLYQPDQLDVVPILKHTGVDAEGFGVLAVCHLPEFMLSLGVTYILENLKKITALMQVTCDVQPTRSSSGGT